MKKFTLLMAAILVCLGFNAKAQEFEAPSLYIAGAFNDYAPEGDSQWALGYLDDGNMFRGTFEIPAGQLSFYLQYESLSIVPGVPDLGDYEAATENVTVLENDTFWSGFWASTGVANSYWVCPTWEGGLLEVTVDMASNEIILSSEVGGEFEGLEVFISGAFNDNAPEGNEIWQLGYLGEGSYRGTFDIPEGKFSFKLTAGFMDIVPADENEEGELEPATANVTVLDGDVFYTGKFATTGFGNVKWVNDAWTGGTVMVTVDFENMDIIIDAGEEQEEDNFKVYVAGEFNNYDPAGSENWQLPLFDEGIYRGIFEVPAGELSFYIQYESINFVPAVMGEDNEPVATAESVDVFVEDPDSFVGYFASTGAANTYWQDLNWKGGALEITVDLNNYQVILSTVGGKEEDTNEVFICGNFNEYAPEGDSIWQLGRLDEGSYRGTFNVPAGELSFYISYNGINIVPGVEEDGDVVAATSNVVVLNGDDYFSGAIASTGVANVFWVNNEWLGGNIEVTLDMVNEEIIISSAENLPENPDEVYILGAFNSYDAAGLETWQLGYLDEGVYRGTFNIPVGELSFYLLYNGISIVPGAEVDGDIVANEANEVVFADGDTFFSGTVATTGMARYFWVNDGWEGGELEVTLDLNENMIILSTIGETPDVINVYIAGAFNDFDPNGLEIWQLGALEDGVSFRGEFEIPAGQFDFYLTGDMFDIVPADENEEGEIEALTENVDVFADGDFFYGLITSTGIANAHWVCNAWEGGVVEITVDFFNNAIIINPYEEPAPDLFWVAGEFNDFDPNGDMQWALAPVDEFGFEYEGVVTIPEGEFSFNLINAYGMIYIPATLASEAVSFTDGVFTGGIDFAMNDEEYAYTWYNESWAGGNLTIHIDLNESTVTFTIGDSKVNGIEAADGEEVIYNLQGIRVNRADNLKGLYIVNGKKVIL